MNPTFIIEMENGQTMKGELYPETAPNSVANFVELANSGFYDGVIFHRVIPGFMIQGGDPLGPRHRRTGLQHPRRICPKRFQQSAQAHARRAVHGAQHDAQLRRFPVLHHGG